MPGLTFAVVAKAADTYDLTAGFCRRLGELTALDIRPRVLPTYADMLARFAAREIDLAWAPPLVAMELEERREARLLTVVQRKFTTGYHSALFVRSDSGLRSIHDLAAASVAWVSPESASGYVVPRWHLRSQRVDLERAFGEEVFLGKHEKVARAVCNGQTAVGATHVALDPVSGRLASAPWQSSNPEGPAIRVLLLVGPIPGDVIALRTGVASEARRQLTAALLALRPADVAVGPLFDATSFEPAPGGHLSLLRRLSRCASEPPLA